jgi:hypothetical protein
MVTQLLEPTRYVDVRCVLCNVINEQCTNRAAIVAVWEPIKTPYE